MSNWSKKGLVEDCETVAVDDLVGDLWRQPCGWVAVRSPNGTASVVKCQFHFLAGTLWVHIDEPVDAELVLDATRARAGGARKCFLCPRANCKRPVRKLYRPRRKAEFRCRHCHSLTYRSTQERNPRVSRLRRDPDLLLETAHALFDKLRLTETPSRRDLQALIRIHQTLVAAYYDEVKRLRNLLKEASDTN